MDDAKIGEGRTEAKVFTQNQIEKMGERISVTEEMGISILSMLFQLNLCQKPLLLKLINGEAVRQRIHTQGPVRRSMLLQLGYEQNLLVITSGMKHTSLLLPQV